MKKRIFIGSAIAITVILISVLIISFNVLGIKDLIREKTGLLYPAPPKIKSIEDVESYLGIEFGENAVLESYAFEKAFGPRSYPKYCEDYSYNYDFVIKIPADNTDQFISTIEYIDFEYDLEARYTPKASEIANGNKFDYIYRGWEAGYYAVPQTDGFILRAFNIYSTKMYILKDSSTGSTTVCISRSYDGVS